MSDRYARCPLYRRERWLCIISPTTVFLHLALGAQTVLAALAGAPAPAPPDRPFDFGKRCDFHQADCFALLLIDAPELNFDDISKCRASLLKSQRRRERGSFGHVWILLVDRRRGLFIECGYTGETSASLPGYFAGVKMLIEGKCSPKMASLGAEISDPIGYLMLERDDGRLQFGSGGHRPTCAWGLTLTRAQFGEMARAAREFPQGPYHLANRNCVSFALRILSICGVHLRSNQTLQVPPVWRFQRREIRLWSRKGLSRLNLSTPDALQASLRRQIPQKEIDLALAWYAGLDLSPVH